MLRSEFESMTGTYPSLALYRIIEKHYRASDVAKDTFCEAYKKNLDGMAERIRSEADAEACNQATEYAESMMQKCAEIELLEKQLARAQEDLEAYKVVTVKIETPMPDKEEIAKRVLAYLKGMKERQENV